MSKPDCNRFKKGDFYFYSRAKGIGIYLHRDSAVQSEYNPFTDTITGDKVTWTSKCRYEFFKKNITKKHITDPCKMRAFIDLENVSRVKFKFIGTSNYCVFTSRKEGTNLLFTDTLWIAGTPGGFMLIEKTLNQQ